MKLEPERPATTWRAIWLAIWLPITACAPDPEATPRAPHDGRSSYLEAVALAERGQHERARTAFERTLAMSPDYLPARIALAKTLLIIGRHRAARVELEHALELDLTLAAAHAGLAAVAFAEDDPRAAIESLHRALAIQPRASRLHYTLAQAYRQTGQPERAAQQLELRGQGTVTLDDPWQEELTAGARAYRRKQLGARRVRSGRYEEAIEVLQPLVAAEPQALRIRINLALALLRTGDLTAAEIHYRWLTTHANQDPAGHIGLGMLAETTSSAATAAEHYRAALNRDPQSARAHLLLARNRWAAGAIETAQHHLEESLHLDPASMLGHLLLAATTARQGDYQRAQSQIEAAIRILPDAPELWQFLARLLATCPDPAIRNGTQSLTWARRADDRLHTRESARTLAMALAENGRFSEATGRIRRLIAPANGLPPEALDELQLELRLYDNREPRRLQWWEPLPAR